jgi:hypothetical protein
VATVSEQDERDSAGSDEPQSMIEKALAEGPLPGLKGQEAAEQELAEQAETPVGQRPEDEADELGGFNLRA